MELFEFFNITAPWNWFWWCFLLMLFGSAVLIYALAGGLLGWWITGGVALCFAGFAYDLWNAKHG